MTKLAYEIFNEKDESVDIVNTYAEALEYKNKGYKVINKLITIRYYDSDLNKVS